MKEPLLRYIACHRVNGDTYSAAMVKRVAGKRINGLGSLRWCMRNGRSVFKIGNGNILELTVVIRPGWPPESQA